MFPAFTQLLPRASCRCFSSRAAVLNVLPASSSVKTTYQHPRPPTAYADITIPDQPTRDVKKSWNNDVGNAVTGEKKTAADIWRERSLYIVPQLRLHPPTDAYYGRSVKVKGTFAEAAIELERILARNKVKQTIRANDRHEKKGVRRRRIKSQQWRHHFANQVRKNVQLVHKMRRRGV
ncbi:hypothetical protein DFH09DRAFT_904166 [Mycena vulgaris]|nr:hypothetical protein DFH09DRAFT_904166 [Mycena vulgaris]